MRLIAPLCLGLALLAAPAAAQPASSDPLAPFRAAQQAEQTGPRGTAFDPFYDRWMRRHRAPADPLGVDARIFVQAQKAIVSRGLEVVAAGPVLAGRIGPAPATAFALFHDRLLTTFRRRLALPDAVAAGLAAEMEAQALALAGVAPAAYAAATGVARPDVPARRRAAAQALDLLWRGSRVDHAFETPYVAGYDIDAVDYVFIDCSIPLTATRRGRVLPVGALLTLHERVEKAILADYATTYPSAHQIALRLEMAAAQATGVPWALYDNLIVDASNAIAARTTAHASDRLDLQPYYTFTDRDNLKLVAAIGRGKIVHASRADARSGPDLPQGAACPAGGLGRGR